MSIALSPRIKRFLKRSRKEKREVLVWRIKHALRQAKQKALFVRRLEPGFWWIAWEDVISASVLAGTFEANERKFVEKFLKPGMTVLDIGAYYGLYTLTASVRVGKLGRVIAFEPSPFQRKRLQWHLRLNRCENVEIEELAIGRSAGEQTLFSIAGESAGYASLRHPAVSSILDPIAARVTTLDEYLRTHQIGTVDFIKIDIEGGELDAFRGATELLRHRSRPVILCELEDVRAKAWGHKAKDTATFVESFGYQWFRPLPGGRLASGAFGAETAERNLIAVPPERMNQVHEMIE